MTDKERKIIVVVDDNPEICFFCRTVLSVHGYQVFTATTGKEGLSLIAAENPDLVILDIMMEEVDSGFQVAAKLAQSNPDLPIIMLSSIAGASSKVFDTSQLPINQLLDKPIQPDKLVEKVKHLIG